MVRYISQTTGAFVTGPGNLNPASTPTLKLATQEPLSVTYLDAAGQPVLLTGGYLPYLGVKPQSDYDAPFVALSTILSAPAAGSFAYTGTLNCNLYVSVWPGFKFSPLHEGKWLWGTPFKNRSFKRVITRFHVKNRYNPLHSFA